MERYKGYRVPTSVINSALLGKLTAYEDTTSNQIHHSVTSPDSKTPEVIGSLTSAEEFLEALDLDIGSDEEHPGERESVSTKADVEDCDEAEVVIPTKKRRRMKMASVASTGPKAPKFLELTELLPPVPKKGNFEVNTVKQSLYFFS